MVRRNPIGSINVLDRQALSRKESNITVKIPAAVRVKFTPDNEFSKIP